MRTFTLVSLGCILLLSGCNKHTKESTPDDPLTGPIRQVLGETSIQSELVKAGVDPADKDAVAHSISQSVQLNERLVQLCHVAYPSDADLLRDLQAWDDRAICRVAAAQRMMHPAQDDMRGAKSY
jgi:hypothetical protein